jgi:capsular polysaccharide biosynthesis protein
MIRENKESQTRVLKWYSPECAKQVREAFCGSDRLQLSAPRIGLINRLKNRKLLNNKDIVKQIKEQLGYTVDEILFESISPKEQIDFNNKHDIIIAAHGANMSSSTFIPAGGLVIECFNNTWVPLNYFSGMSLYSGKSHVSLYETNKPLCKNNEKGVNMRINPQKIIDSIKHF